MPPPPGSPAQYGSYAPQPYAAQARYGGFWIRAVAYIIDAVILGVAGGIVAVIFHVNLNNPQSSGYGPAQLVNFLLGGAYFIGFWSAWSASPGQRILNLRVIDANTMQPIEATKAIIRYIGLFIAFAVCLIGVIWVAFDGRKQGWADKIASTLVIQG